MNKAVNHTSMPGRHLRAPFVPLYSPSSSRIPRQRQSLPISYPPGLHSPPST